MSGVERAEKAVRGASRPRWNSESRPRPAILITSICHSLSVAAANPAPKKSSSSSAASTNGTPSASRRMMISPRAPLREMTPCVRSGV